ncbi:hypothetical protein PO878_20470 [Iamia majanohamensis]|uniref:Gram-positive cocci surface proteins LPxTG domain-containing protein n=1 Tax=Iamia majanohamensis TaxID=467976 RepID=A0AAE9Y5J9_9ACTN|nr:hypothetical protein [Iamia majanohamensis]WCO66870.1 hypothetical protein PO878_20470 [Iamia majanohamensis]
MSKTLHLLSATAVAAALTLIPAVAGATDTPTHDCRPSADGVVADGPAPDDSVTPDDGAAPDDDGVTPDDGAVPDDDGVDPDDGSPDGDGLDGDDLVPEDLGDITAPDDGDTPDGVDLVPEDLGDITAPDDAGDDLPPPDDLGDIVLPDGQPDDGADDATPTDLGAGDGDLAVPTSFRGDVGSQGEPCPVPQDGIQTGAGGTAGTGDPTGALLAAGVGGLALAAGVSAARARRRTA